LLQGEGQTETFRRTKKNFAERLPDPAAVYHRNSVVQKLNQSVVVRGRLASDRTERAGNPPDDVLS
jgi:hypothetical protein